MTTFAENKKNFTLAVSCGIAAMPHPPTIQEVKRIAAKMALMFGYTGDIALVVRDIASTTDLHLDSGESIACKSGA